MIRQRMLSIAATVVILLPSWLLGGEGEIPPPENWVTVKTVSSEFTHVRSQPCSCGGAYEVVVQSTGEFKDRNYDHLHCRCRQCGKRRDFYFDVTGIFAEYKLSQSDEAKAAADAALDRRFPIVTAESLSALKALIDDENPHVRMWGTARIAKLNLPEAGEFLLNRYMDAGLIGSVQFQSALKEMGAELLPLIEQRFENPENAASFSLMNLLEDIPLPQSARLVERELHREMQKDEGERRICYITLGQLAFKESESILLSAFEKEQVNPDDSLIWALGRCGTGKSILIIRKAFRSENEDLRLAAIVALGLLNDRAAIPDLMTIVTKGDGGDLKKYHNLVHNAIYALGHLRAKEAIPLLIQKLREQPRCEYHYSPGGIFDSHDEDWWTHAGDYVSVTLHALVRMGTRDVLPDLQRILRDDEYYLSFDEAADAAAKLDLLEAAPEIIARLAKDHNDNVKLFGKARERYSPSLRKLTGQPFGEDPKLWQEWLSEQPVSALAPEN